MQELDEELALEATISGIQAVAAGPATGMQERQWPNGTEPMTMTRGQLARLRKGKKRADALGPVVGESAGVVAEAYDRDGVGLLAVAFHESDPPVVAFGLSPDDLEPLAEKAPPDQEVEEWILANKRRFKKEYGPEWRRYLYGAAWKRYGKEKASAALPKTEGYVHMAVSEVGGVDLQAGDDTYPDALAQGLLDRLSRKVRHLLIATDERDVPSGQDDDLYQDPSIVARFAPAFGESGHRPMTAAERGGLQLRPETLLCETSHFPGRGFAAHAGNVRTGFFARPRDIPRASLRLASRAAR